MEQINEKKKTKILVIVIVLLLLGLAIYFLFVRAKPDSLIQLEALYNDKGELIKRGFSLNDYSIVAGLEGVKFATFRITAENKDKIPLTLGIDSLTPNEINYAIPTQKFNVPSGSKAMWVTGMVDITPYEGKIQDFCAKIKSDEVFVLRGSDTIEGCISLLIQKNPVSADFDIQIDSGIGDTKINPSCTENWVCSDWGVCSNNIQTRTCTDSNKCGVIVNKPNGDRVCEYPIIPGYIFTSNAVSGNYRDNDVWIKLNEKQYFYSGYSTYNCLIENKITETPEGYIICSRPGYAISSRVYLDDKKWGIIFKP